MSIGSQVGAYRLVKQIGAGGMGEVWMAEHALLGRRAAIKLLHPAFSARPEIVTRFFNEARAATSIADPGIVQIFDFGHHSDGTAYIVMELLDGETLDARWRHTGALPIIDALRIMRQVASSLGAAHARGIVHRDLKPENIFLVRDPEVAGGERPKVLDFGIAKLNGNNAVKTQTSAVMGTPLFMSPEQCRGAGRVDQRADVYSLGCVLYTITVGSPVFDADGVGDIIAMHLREPAPRASSRLPGFPQVVDDLIARCLDKQPDNRFTSGTDLAAAIGAALETLGRDGVVPIGSRAFADPIAASPTTLSGTARSLDTRPPVRGRRWLAIGGLALVGVIGGAVAIGASRSADPATVDAAIAAPPAPRPDVVAAPKPAPPPVVVDPATTTRAQLRDLLARFPDWATAHADAPCPHASDLDANVTDAWGTDMTVTCVDQPSDQRIGIVSAGPDRRFGTADDVASWQLDGSQLAAIRGARWTRTVKQKPGRVVVQTPAKRPDPPKPDPVVVTAKPEPAPPPPAAEPPPPKADPPTSSIKLGSDGIPITR